MKYVLNVEKLPPEHPGRFVGMTCAWSLEVVVVDDQGGAHSATLCNGLSLTAQDADSVGRRAIEWAQNCHLDRRRPAVEYPVTRLG